MATAVVPLATSLTSSLFRLNKPFGTCSPSAPTMEAFLSCWKHPIPDNYMPAWKGGAQGWGFVWCLGAKNGKPPEGSGCLQAAPYPGEGPCETSALHPCAPAGTISSLRGGGFQFAVGSALDESVEGLHLSSLLGGDLSLETIGVSTKGGRLSFKPIFIVLVLLGILFLMMGSAKK